MKGTKSTSMIRILSLVLLVPVYAFSFQTELFGKVLPWSPSSVLIGEKGGARLGISARNISPISPSPISTSIAETSYSPVRSSPSSTSDESTSISNTPDSGDSGNMSPERRRLIIILSSVLGSVGLILFAVVIFLWCRYRKGKAPFRNRGATPIDDDEIESWRVTEPKQQSPIPDSKSPQTPRGASIDSIALKNSPPWVWAGSPGTLHSITSPSNIPPPPPAFIAKAPNSRIGLTDETIPGAEAFIPVPKRQSSRLSKAPPGHSRTKSRRSSISAKSVRSNNGGSVDLPKTTDKLPAWYDLDLESVGTGLRDTEYTNSSPGTSLFDGISVSAGGLSPRPKSKSQLRPLDTSHEIGRAIS